MAIVCGQPTARPSTSQRRESQPITDRSAVRPYKQVVSARADITRPQLRRALEAARRCDNHLCPDLEVFAGLAAVAIWGDALHDSANDAGSREIGVLLEEFDDAGVVQDARTGVTFLDALEMELVEARDANRVANACAPKLSESHSLVNETGNAHTSCHDRPELVRSRDTFLTHPLNCPEVIL